MKAILLAWLAFWTLVCIVVGASTILSHARRRIRERHFLEACESARDFGDPEPEWVDVFESTPIFDAVCWDLWESEMSDR